HVPQLGDTAHVPASDLLRVSRIYTPDGSPALEFVVGTGVRGVVPFIVTETDIVFQPWPTDDLLDSRIPHRIDAMPPLVAYTEMMRDAQWVGEGGRDVDAGTLLRTRSFIPGALRFGLRPLAAVYWWVQAYAAAGGEDVGLPPFRDNPLWTDLVEEAGIAAGQG